MRTLAKIVVQIFICILFASFSGGEHSSLHAKVAANPPDFAQQVSESIRTIQEAYSIEPRFRRHFAVQAHSAFILQPSTRCSLFSSGEVEMGVILVHDLYSSPYLMQELGGFLSSECALVYGLQLQGHGTKMDALDDATLEAWQKQLETALQDISQKTKQVIIIGTGLGAYLAYLQAEKSADTVDLLVLNKFSLGSCKPSSYSQAAFPSDWQAQEESTFAKNYYTDDIVRYNGKSENAEQQLQLAHSRVCKLVKQKGWVNLPTLLLYGDRTFRLSIHRLDLVRQNRNQVRLAYFHNANLDQSENTVVSKNYQVKFHDFSRQDGDLQLVADGFLFISKANPWYGQNNSRIRCRFAAHSASRRSFCVNRGFLPELIVNDAGEQFSIFYPSYNPNWNDLLQEIRNFMLKELKQE